MTRPFDRVQTEPQCAMRPEGLVVGRGVERGTRGKEELRYDDQHEQARQSGEALRMGVLLDVG
jgi:hypothetical protein